MTNRDARVDLSLNNSKCDIIGIYKEARPNWILSGFKFLEPKTVETVLLGASLFTNGFQFALNHHCKSILLTSNRLQHLSSHEAFFVL